MPHREFAEDADAFSGVAAESEMAGLSHEYFTDRLQDQDADAPDVAVFVEAGVGSLLAPVAGEAEARYRQFPPKVLLVLRPGRACGNGTRRHDTVGIALALVQARTADQPERRPLG